MSEPSLQEKYDQARRHHAAGHLDDAEKLFREILAREPFHPDVLHFLGIVLTQKSTYPQAIDALVRALEQRPEDAAITGDLGAALQLAQRYDEATAAYRRVLDLQPDSAAAWFNLSQSLYMKHQYAEAIEAIRKSAVLEPRSAEIQRRCAVFLRDAGKDAEALDLFVRAIDLKPDFAEAFADMAPLLHKVGRFPEAVAAWRRALEINPRDWSAAYNLGTILRDAAMLDEAIAALRQSLAANPNEPRAWNNLAGLLKDAGQLDESLVCYDRAIALRPQSAATHSNRLYTLHFHPDFGAKKILAEHLEFAGRHIAGIAPANDHPNDRDPDRPLRIGYVSADFRRHPVGLSFEFLLENHDHQKFQTFCFSNVRHADACTQRMERLPHEWIAVHSLSDDQFVSAIRDRKIDILVDLSLHMAHNRLTAFAQKPAPIQVSYLGYPSTTGVSAVDYRLSDAWIDPPGTDGNYTEKTIRLPSTYLCWRWGGDEAAVQPLPATRNGHITFGSLNNFCKVTPQVLQVWGELLAKVKESRLILRCPAGAAARRMLEALSQCGIAGDRIEIVGLLPWDEYVRLFHRQDIGLDPFPYPGHTTSLDSYWMGVPVVTLTGDTAVSRVGASLLGAMGLPELIAENVDRYIAIAEGLAKDLPRLADLRIRLRDSLKRSPISDGAQFARDVEGVYRKMWKDWLRSRV